MLSSICINIAYADLPKYMYPQTEDNSITTIYSSNGMIEGTQRNMGNQTYYYNHNAMPSGYSTKDGDTVYYYDKNGMPNGSAQKY